MDSSVFCSSFVPPAKREDYGKFPSSGEAYVQQWTAHAVVNKEPVKFRHIGIELDVRRYIAALLAALHLAKVTSEQQKQEEQQQQRDDQQKTPTKPVPMLPVPSIQVVPSSPPTASTVKTTPEGKSATPSEDNPNSPQ